MAQPWKHREDGSFLPENGEERLSPEERQRRNTERKRRARQLNREEHTRKNREWNFRRKYGITLDQYDEMRAVQKGLCAICQVHEDDLPGQFSRQTSDGVQVLGSALVVDHCHQKNQVRSLLCHKCNQGIGCFKEDPKVLESAIRYLGLWPSD